MRFGFSFVSVAYLDVIIGGILNFIHNIEMVIFANFAMIQPLGL